ncbi:MAG TPA: DUF3662 and FHA domain-containing protein [Solirubrobacteraceae bacterium]|jgi:hypothetical protein|nr:DUF3662 and FHA domain-containing protein [Solirubrobacteraceae bacterium]
MNVLKSVETTIANLLEGAFGRIFRSEVRPVELARKLAREMDEHRTESLARVYAPSEFSVWLSPRDRERYEDVEHEVTDELCAYLLEHARREGLNLSSPPRITFHTDERLSLGEFGIQAQHVRHSEPRPRPARAPAPPVAAPPVAAPPVGASAPPSPPEQAPGEGAGETMIYSTSARVRGPLEDAQARHPLARALLAVGPRRLLLPPAGGVVGRSRDCDIVLDDAGISRRHAEIRPRADGWTVVDLGSTNGLALNGKPVQGEQVLHAGDKLELGSTEIVFELQ